MSVLGASTDDNLTTGSGSDTIKGGLGNDTINASAGNDSLLGEDGDDILSGGKGSDTITGGFGSDTFIFISSDLENDVTDTITDLQNGENIGISPDVSWRGLKASDHTKRPADSEDLGEDSTLEAYVQKIDVKYYDDKVKSFHTFKLLKYIKSYGLKDLRKFNHNYSWEKIYHF